MLRGLGCIALGIACFLAGWLASIRHAGEDATWGAWLGTTAAAGYLVGRLWPAQAVLGTVLVMLPLPVCVYVSVASRGGLAHNTDPLGGLAGIAIISVLLWSWTPIPLLLALVAAHRQRRHSDAAETAPPPEGPRDAGRPPPP